MSEGATAHPSPTMAYLPPDGDPVFGFLTTKWIDPGNLASTKAETEKDRNTRISMENTYRQHTNPTSWNRYCTLGRYAVDGNTFDTIWKEFEVDPLRVHCLIWYNYMYHVDRNMDIPEKLDSWATKRSQVYLAIHAATVLSVDTNRMTWKAFTLEQSISTPWTKVGAIKQKQSQKQPAAKSIQSVLPFKRASSLIGESPTPTITEGNEIESSSAMSLQTNPSTKGIDKPTTSTRDANDTTSQTDSIGKVSALIKDLDVPLNDGTHRITIRWKVDFDIQNSSKQSAELTRRIYDLLNELFSDDDGLLYKWGHDDLNHFNTISQMTPEEVRSFISPSVTLIPSLSMVIVPIRFGFAGKSPSHWRNKEVTKMTLESQSTTLSISNSKTTSGKLVIAGYILLKAPMTTHRIRYLQSLRRILPDSTPHFDILLHRKTPLGQNINHLVVQCGEKHVHPLSQILLTVLTGYRSPVYIPRFAFADMSTDQAIKLFETHDQFIKSLRSIALFPLLNNLDITRIEHFPDGNTLERSTRDWATGIMSIDGTESAKCDVVNGGLDQRAYLLVPPQFEEAARLALDDYRRRIFPFTQREARFRESVGPPTVIHVVKEKIDANIQTIESLSSKEFWQQAPSSVKLPTPNKQSSPSDSISNPSTASASSHTSRPPTSLESLQKQYNMGPNPRQRNEATDEMTNTTATTRSHGFSTNSSTQQQARFKEIEKTIARQQKDIQLSNKVSSDKLQQIESQLKSQLENVTTDMTNHINSLEEKMITSMQQQLDAGNFMKELNEKIGRLTDAVAILLSKTPGTMPHDTNSSLTISPTTAQVIAVQNPDDISMKTSNNIT